MSKTTIVGGALAVVAAAAAGWLWLPRTASAEPLVEVWKSPTCACCGQWVGIMKDAGFHVKVHQTDDLMPVMQREGVPNALGSCHTATIGGYAIEGHVPSDVIRKLLRQHPADIRGLAVPGMVSGSPGMEDNGVAQHYRVIAFHTDGSTTVYARR